jgi:hypothetical protein
MSPAGRGLLLVACLAAVGALRAEETPWAFRTPSRPAVPAVNEPGHDRNPIDAFLLARLRAEGRSFAPEADRRTLVRRLTFDLTGLPPTPEEIDAFVSDSRPGAYERLVERLLASPRHGERWATFWLDLARFAETDGFKSDDLRPAAWRYRDYVVRAFNADTPYDRFLREQIAGDELYPGDAEALIATGFNRHFPDEYNAVNLEQRRQEILNDVTDTTTQVVLGLTVGCARCHDHKFDPITQEDYYRVQAFFAAYQPAELPLAAPDEVERRWQQLRAWEERTAELRRRMDELEGPHRETMAARKKSRFPKEYQDFYELPAEKRTPLQQQIAALVAKQVQVTGEEASKGMKPEVRQEWEGLSKQMAELRRARPPEPPAAMALTDIGPEAPPTHLLKRGDWRKPGPVVAPGFLSAIDDRAADVPTPAPGARTTGRRAELARWLTRPENPLTARVMVNRLWQHHFGRGLVATPSDFGAQGEPPTHPELLDWLAVEFVERGWSLKEMHRLMVTSAAYRQASVTLSPGGRGQGEGVRPDPDNRLLGRASRRRLEGEALRDAMLAAAGLLSEKAGGPGVYPELPEELGVPKAKWPVSTSAAERNRRSVYVFAKRNLRYPLFDAFDAPDANETCARRFTTTTAPQALMLFNGKLVLDIARAFAARVTADVGTDPDRVIDRAYRLALGRAPDDDERRTMRDFLARGGSAADLCHAVLNLNEFLYVD